MRRKITNELWEQIKTAVASGIGLREIARNMGISTDSFCKALAKRNDGVVATPIEAVAMSMQQRGERHVERLASVSERAVDHIETMNGPEILNSVDQIEKLDKVARRTFGLNDIPATGFTLNVLNLGDGSLEVRE